MYVCVWAVGLWGCVDRQGKGWKQLASQGTCVGVGGVQLVAPLLRGVRGGALPPVLSLPRI